MNGNLCFPVSVCFAGKIGTSKIVLMKPETTEGLWTFETKKRLRSGGLFVMSGVEKTCVNGPAWITPVLVQKERRVYLYKVTNASPANLSDIFSLLNPGCRNFFEELRYWHLVTMRASDRTMNASESSDHVRLAQLLPYPGPMRITPV